MSSPRIQVETVTPAPLKGDLQAHFKVEDVAGGRLRIVGWAFARYGQVVAVEVKAGEGVVASAVPRMRRPDVAEAFPAADAAGTSGFELAIEAQGTGRSNLEVLAVLMEGSRHPLGWVSVMVDGR